MKNWQKDRNYRKYKNEDGTFRYVITIEGEDVEVTAEVYKAYSQSDRRERYMGECEVGILLSLEQFDKDGVQLEYLTDKHIMSAEDAAFRKMLMESLNSAVRTLTPDERDLLHALYYDGVTEQEYAGHIGLSQVAIHKRKKRIFKKISELMVIKP